MLYWGSAIRKNIRSDVMVSLTFDFNMEKVKNAGYTTDELLQPMREHAKKYGIAEPEYGVFQMDGEDAMCLVGMFVVDITDENHEYISYLNSWLFDVDGDIEDCVQETLKWYQKKGIDVKNAVGV